MTELHFFEIADDVFINAAQIIQVTDTDYGCLVLMMDGSIYKPNMPAGEFIQRVRGSRV